MIFVFGLGATLISLIMAFFFRDGIEMTQEGEVVINPPKHEGSGLQAIKKASRETWTTIRSVVSEKYFWVFISMLALTVPVRTVFFHFHYTFPKYGIRVLGEGAKIGSIYGVLNPVLIVILVPIVAYFTKKVSSYKMMIWGAAISSLSCLLS